MAEDTTDKPHRATKADKLAKVHEQALREFDQIQTAQADVRRQCLEDRRFYQVAGAQWEDALGQQFENKPRFEINKTHLAVIRVINEYRNNRISVDFTPKDGQADETADLCDGLYRADERDSVAQEAYDNAFEEGVGGGIGAWRLRADYEDEEDDEDDRQRVRIEPIFEADTCVFFDLNAKRRDKSDATRCFVLTGMPRDAYEDEYGDDVDSWPESSAALWGAYDWFAADIVYVAEYYRIEEKKEVVRVFRGLDEQDMEVPAEELEGDEGEEKLETLLATGFREVRQKRLKRKRVHKYIMSGGRVLEDCGYIAGRCIPIVPFFGKRGFVDGVERCMGHVRLAKDAQRLMNMLRSWLAEIATMSPVEKPILTPEQIIGHTSMWADDSVQRFPYLLVNPMTDANGQKQVAGPIGYTKAPSIPQAMAALLQVTEQDLSDLLGNQQAGEQMQSNISGKVVELIQQKLDMQAYIYMSNFAVAMKRSGEIWLSMQKDILVEEKRRMKTVTEDGEVSSAEVNVPAYDPKTGAEFVQNDIAGSKLEVWADVGPSSSSQRASTIRAVTGLAAITDDPVTKQVLTSYAAMNLEGEGLKDFRDYFRQQLIKAGAVKPTTEERQELEAAAAQQAEKPDPNAIYLEASAKAQDASAVQKLADAKKKEAETLKTMSEVHGQVQDRALGIAASMQQEQPPEPPPSPVNLDQ